MPNPALRAIRPESGATGPPASSDSSVDLPAPFRPTTPMRSPVATPSDTLLGPVSLRGGAGDTRASSVRSPKALLTFSTLIRFTMGPLPSRRARRHHGHAGDRPGRAGHRP